MNQEMLPLPSDFLAQIREALDVDSNDEILPAIEEQVYYLQLFTALLTPKEMKTVFQVRAKSLGEGLLSFAKAQNEG